MPTVVVRGARLNYRQVGSGPDLVLVHGLAANQAFWSLQLVADLAQTHRVTTYDLRGHGYSEPTDRGYRTDELAADLEALCAALDLRRPHVVGHSYGAVIALELAARAPGLVRSLVVADCRLRQLQPEQPLRDAPEWPRIRAAMAAAGFSVGDDEPELGFHLLAALGSPAWAARRARLAAHSAFVPFSGSAGGRMLRRWQALLRDTSLREEVLAGSPVDSRAIGQFAQPLLLVYGERSPQRLTGQRLARLAPRARYVEVPGAGHFHPFSRADFFLAVVRTFLTEIERGEGNKNAAGHADCALAEAAR